MNRPDASAPADHSRHARLAATLAGGFRRLKFPADIEADYTQAHARTASGIISRMLPWVTLLYAAAALVMYGGASSRAFHLWLLNGLLPVGLVFSWLWLMRLTGEIDRRPLLHTGLCVGVALFATVRTIFIVGDEPGVIYITYQVIYLLFIAFTVAQLRVQAAVGISVVTGCALLLDVLAEGLTADWLAFGQYYVATLLISSVIGYLMEHRERQEWLRSELAMLEKGEMDELRRQADADARQQRVLGDYLERVAGNLTPAEIAGRSLKFLVEQTGAHIGTVFIATDRGWRRASSYGLDGENALPEELGRSESLIGQAAIDGRRLRLRHLPADYHAIRTATGSMSPAELLVEPVRQQDNSLAVIELGRLSPFDESTLGLVDRISQAMAATLVAANAREVLARASMSEFII